MRPIQFSEQNLVIAKDQPEYIPLPAYKHRVDDPTGLTTFCWKLTWRERVRVALSGRLWHTVLTFNGPLQPQRIEVNKPDFTRLEMEQLARNAGMTLPEMMEFLRAHR